MRVALAFTAMLSAVLLAAACTGTTRTPSPASVPSLEPSASAPAETQEPSTAPPSAAPSAFPSESSPFACDAIGPTDEPDWATLHADRGDFDLQYPDDWRDISGESDFELSALVDPATLSGSGAAQTPTTPSDAVASRDERPRLDIIEIQDVTSPLADIYAREEARLSADANIHEIAGRDVRVCVGAVAAIGLDLFASPQLRQEIDPEASGAGGDFFERRLWLVRDGRLYTILWLDDGESALDTFERILATWAWTDEVTPGPSESVDASDPFELATAADEVVSQSRPDPAWYADTFPAGIETIYAIYRLRPGLSGEVKVTLRRGGDAIRSSSLELPEGHWAWNEFAAASLAPGDYDFVLEFTDSGARRTVPFTIEP